MDTQAVRVTMVKKRLVNGQPCPKCVQAEEMLRIRIQRGMTTVGSGGSAPAMNPVEAQNTMTALGTARANDTSAASAGTITQILEECFNVRTGYIYMPVPEARPTIAVSTRLAFNLVAAPADSLTMSGTIIWEET